VTLSLLDDSVLVLSVAVSAGCVVVLFAFLSRYRKLTTEATKSAQLAKNIWDAMNSRLAVMDARIIDMMAKVEVYSAQSSRKSTVRPPAAQETRTQPPGPQVPQAYLRTPSQTSQVSQRRAPEVTSPSDHTREVDIQILHSLAEGPRTSRDIKEVINKSREHTARLMKILYGKGLVVRNDRNKPYVYEITDAGRRYLEGN
jgi:predicted transcriptional regulator